MKDQEKQPTRSQRAKFASQPDGIPNPGEIVENPGDPFALTKLLKRIFFEVAVPQIDQTELCQYQMPSQ